jgi:hypothetical protein
MKKLPLFFLLIFAGLITSCEENFRPCYPIDSNRIHIQVLDGEGKDLLDQTQEGVYQSNRIKIYYERNGKLEEFYNGGHSNMRRNFRIDPPGESEDYYGMQVILDTEKTVIQWNNTEADTLLAKIVPSNNPDFCPTRIVREIYHQGDLKWDGSTSMTGRGFTIVKER